MDKKPLSINNLNTHNNIIPRRNGNGIQYPAVYGNPVGTNPKINGVNESFKEMLDKEKSKVEASFPSNLNNELVDRQMETAMPIEEASAKVDDKFNLYLKDEFIKLATDFDGIYDEKVEMLLSEYNSLLVKREKMSQSDSAFQDIIKEYDLLVKEAESIIGYSFDEWTKADTASFKVTL